MMFGNLIICKNCKRELQPNDVLLGEIDGELVRACRFCGFEEKL